MDDPLVETLFNRANLDVSIYIKIKKQTKFLCLIRWKYEVQKYWGEVILSFQKYQNADVVKKF